MSASIMPTPKPTFDGIAGLPLVGGRLNTYAAGTTTPKATYTNAAGTVPQANPIILNARGEPDNAIYWNGAYYIELYDALGNLIYSVDNFQSGITSIDLSANTGAGLVGFSNALTYAAGTVGKFLVDLAASAGSSFIGFIQSGAGAVLRTLQDKAREKISIQDFPLTHAGFQQALSAASGKILVVNAAITINTTTVPAGVSLVVENGALITLAAAQTLTINGPFSAGIYQVFASAGVEFPAGSEVNAEWWGSGSTAFQRAIDSGPLYSTLKSGQIRVKLSTPQTWASCIDLTTRNYVNLKFAPGLDILSTSTDYIFDCTSMAYSLWENVTVHSSTARVGQYLNRGTTRPSAEYNVYKDCSITLASNTAANSGTGTIARYNSRSELATYINCNYQADCPTIDENKTRAYLLPIYETMQPFGTGWDSATLVTENNCSYVATGNYAPSQYFDNVVGFEHINCYWRKLAVVNGTCTYAIISNNIFRSKFTGDCETWPQFMSTLRVANFLDIDLAIGAATLTATGIINVDSIGADVGGISNSKIKVESLATAIAGSCVVYGSRGYNNTSVMNNDITSNLPTILSADKTLRLNGAIDGNIETSGNRRIVNNVCEYATVGAFIANGTSLVYTVPALVGYAEITAAYRLLGGTADQQTVTLAFTRWNSGAGQIILKSSGSIGANNRITYALVGSVITFTSASNVGGCFIGYQIKESYGDAS